MRPFPLLPVPLLTLALTGCLPELPAEKPNEGNVAGDCTDRADNDDDGAFDCEDDGCAASPDCAVAPAPPEGLAVAVTPEQPGDDADLLCAIATEAVDPNGDAVTYTYAWSVDGADAGLPVASVGNALTVPGQAWTCTVTPSDGTRTGTPASATVSIERANAAPSAPVVAITPEAPNDDEGLRCAVVGESVDPDGDTVTYAFAWSVDGVDAGIAGESVDPARTSVGETWTCSVTATDGSATSAAGSASVGIVAGYAIGSLTATDTSTTYTTLIAPALSGVSEATFEAWFRVDATTTNGQLFSTDQAFYCAVAGDRASAAYKKLVCLTWGFTSGCGSTSCAADTAITSDYAITLGAWFHLAYVFDRGTWTLFVDGEQQGASSNTTYGGTLPANSWFRILGSGRQQESLNGAVDVVRVSRSVRYSSTFVPSLTLPADDDTVQRWAFDEGAGATTVEDLSGGVASLGDATTWITVTR